LIPGKVVFKYFTEIKPIKRSITLFLKNSENGEYEFYNVYFGEKVLEKSMYQWTCGDLHPHPSGDISRKIPLFL
jgi:hypothetical protein